MPININEAVTQIKKVGSHNVRILPMPGQDINTGTHQIEIYEQNTWKVLLSGVPRTTAEDLVKQATNRMILG